MKESLETNPSDEDSHLIEVEFKRKMPRELITVQVGQCGNQVCTFLYSCNV